MARRKKSSWDKNNAIDDLIDIKSKSIKAMYNEQFDEKSGETKIVVDQKAATMAVNCIKELNSLCGVFNTQEQSEENKVVINDDI